MGFTAFRVELRGCGRRRRRRGLRGHARQGGSYGFRRDGRQGFIIFIRGALGLSGPVRSPFAPRSPRPRRHYGRGGPRLP